MDNLSVSTQNFLALVLPVFLLIPREWQPGSEPTARWEFGC